MKIYYILIIILFTAGCSIIKLQEEGYVQPENFHHEVKFDTYKSLIIVPARVNGVLRNFLFDTGAHLTVVQRDTLIGKSTNVSGASGRSSSLGNEVINSFEIGGIDFKNTNALNGDLEGLKDKVPDFGGFIGQSIISKANWLIDYPQNTLQIANHDLSDNTFQKIEIDRKDGSPFTFIQIEGKKYKAIIDLGASSAITVPTGTKLSEEILKKYSFKEVENESFTIGGVQKVKQQIMTLPTVRLGDHEFTNVEVKVKPSSQIRLGNDIFKDYMVYIDNISGDYKIKKVN